MSTAEIVNIILVVLCAIAYGICIYFRTKGSATAAATQLIGIIEDSDLLGPEKMGYVVKKLYETIPMPLRTIFTLERLQVLAQEVYDNMKKYALEYMERIDNEKETAPDEKLTE